MGVLLNLRQAVIKKVSDKSDQDIREMIVGSVDGDEHALPGLGVLFELIWKHSDETERQEYVTKVQQYLHSQSSNPS